MEGTCLSCVKYLMVFFNALIFLAGLCLVAVGVWAVADPGGVAEVVSSHHPLLLRSVHVILAVGAVFLLLGLLGCCGALCESRRTLTFFFILLLIIFMVELVTAIVAFVFREQLNEDYFALELKMRYQGDNATDVFSRFWNSAMKTFGCCGVRGPSDFWEGTLFWQLSSGKIIPEACCKGDIHAESEATMDRLRCLLGDPRHRNEQVPTQAPPGWKGRSGREPGAYLLLNKTYLGIHFQEDLQNRDEWLCRGETIYWTVAQDLKTMFILGV